MRVRKGRLRSTRSRVSRTNGRVWRAVPAVQVRSCCRSDNAPWLLCRFETPRWEWKLHRHSGNEGETKQHHYQNSFLDVSTQLNTNNICGFAASPYSSASCCISSSSHCLHRFLRLISLIRRAVILIINQMLIIRQNAKHSVVSAPQMSIFSSLSREFETFKMSVGQNKHFPAAAVAALWWTLTCVSFTFVLFLRAWWSVEEQKNTVDHQIKQNNLWMEPCCHGYSENCAPVTKWSLMLTDELNK